MTDSREPRAPQARGSASSAPWTPMARAARAWVEGVEGATLQILVDGEARDTLPASYLHRSPGDYPDVEVLALNFCRGRVLDIGAGAGAHALELQRRGLAVTALDIAPEAAETMRSLGVRDVRTGDIFAFREGTFDTLLMLMNGIGLVGSLAGLDRFLFHAKTLLAPGGQLLADSGDLRRDDDPGIMEDVQRRTAQGIYFGETRFRMMYGNELGEPFPWLFVDPATFRKRAEPLGWRFQVVFEASGGAYLARLTRAS